MGGWSAIVHTSSSATKSEMPQLRSRATHFAAAASTDPVREPASH